MLAKNEHSLSNMTLEQAQARIVSLEIELDALNVRLIEAEGGKSYFISHALNELNNPLTAITGLVEQVIAMQNPRWEDVRSSLLWIKDESTYLEFQLKNLFMAAELEAGVAKFNRARVDVHSVFNAVITRYVLVAQKRGIRIESNQGHALFSMSGAILSFPTDSAALSLIFANLLDNAIKWSPAGGTVRITLDITEDGLKLLVEDEGPGMPEKQRAHAFDRFWQADSSTTKMFRGLGLGLTVSADTAQQMGGSLSITSADSGAGVAFALQLPLLEEDQLMDAPDENVFFFDDGDEIDVRF